jgi:chaperonin cofactor prefoldin
MLDDQDSLALQLETLNGDLEDKQAKVNKLREEIKKAKYEDRIIEKSQAIRSLNDQKDALNAEFASLSSQANVRAKLDLKRQEVKSKGSEIKSLCVPLLLLTETLETNATSAWMPQAAGSRSLSVLTSNRRLWRGTLTNCKGLLCIFLSQTLPHRCLESRNKRERN